LGLGTKQGRGDEVIARKWSGIVRASDADAYVKYVEQTGVATQRSTAGNRGSMIFKREVDGGVEVTVLSLWNDMDSIRRFAGDQPEVAIYYPEDDRYLIDRPSHVEHYEVPVFEFA
jgi:heme-degrading monooxygenase HmoA